MKIVRLELFGFKSFKDKTIVSFNQPITAIVGSNGCGKSNVVDALYWVMGDMSPKHLRGSSMSDVIFSGSRDVAAMDMAEVTLVLERDPLTDPELPPQFQGSLEIQITRRYYRSGDSEYFINKIHCRLRDIQEFFMDTGLGAKAYSIIEQGAITRMVAQKPEERRVVIEEVAGIMKFKARKAETERKLESTQTNMSRIDDILKDLQKQLTSLKRQTEKAEKFKVFNDQLRELEISLASKEWLDRNSNQGNSLLEITEVKRQLSEIETGVELERNKLDESRAQLEVVEIEIKSRREDARQSELQIKDLETRMARFSAQKDGNSRKLEADQKTLEEIQHRISAIGNEITEIENQLLNHDSEAEELLARSQLAEETFEKAKENSQTLQTQAAVLKDEAHQIGLEFNTLEQRKKNLEKSQLQSENRKNQLQAQLNTVSVDLEHKELEKNQTLGHLEYAFSTRKDLEEQKLGIDQRLSELDKKRSDHEIVVSALQSNLVQVRVRKEQLEILDKEMQGFEKPTQFLSNYQQSHGLKNLLLAHLAKAPQALEKSLEAVLGRNMQRLSLDSINDVESLRQVLATSDDNEVKSGRAAFWIPDLCKKFENISMNVDPKTVYLSTQREEVPGPDGLMTFKEKPLTLWNYLLTHKDVIGPLDQLLSEEMGAQDWFAFVKNYWVVRDRAAVQSLLSDLGGLPVNFVSLEGDLFTQEGVVDLAPVSAQEDGAVTSLLQRRREITELKGNEDTLQSQLEVANAAKQQTLHEISAQKDLFRELTVKLSALNPDVDRHTTLLRQEEAQLARLLEKKEMLQNDFTTLVDSEESLRSELEEVLVSMDGLVGKKAEFEEKLQSISQQVTEAREQEGLSNRVYNQALGALKDFEKTLESNKGRRAALEQERDSALNRQDRLSAESQNLIAELSQVEMSIQELVSERQLREQEHEIRVQAFEEIATQLETCRAQVQQFEKSLDKASSDLRRLSQRSNELETSIAVNDVELKNISEKIQAQYQIAFDTLEPEQIAEMSKSLDIEVAADPMAGKKQIETLRNKIDNLGKINMVAVEEFQDLSQRYEYLYIQRQDVFNGMEQLREAMERIDRESRARFAEAFNAVNEAFQKTFPILFGGGQAELRLTVPENMLETGVEIVAQPPGKKLQNVTLLSGGEKALTAVSLIFGIFSIKPSPFAVLDEVDAPLDDANVGRFNTQVRRMAEKSQIILITHHKKTMESCDALFGVTMERPGISKVASARIGELKG